MSMPAASASEPTSVQVPWLAYVVVGSLFFLLGVVGLGVTAAFTIYSVLIGGLLLSIAGALQLFNAVFARPIRIALVQFVCGVLYLAAGIFAVLDPGRASMVLTLLLAISLIVTGLSRVLLAFMHRRLLTWLAMVVGGGITLLVGVYLLRRWPWDSAWVIGLLFAIDLMSQGLAWILLGFHLRGARRMGAIPKSPPPQ